MTKIFEKIMNESSRNIDRIQKYLNKGWVVKTIWPQNDLENNDSRAWVVLKKEIDLENTSEIERAMVEINDIDCDNEDEYNSKTNISKLLSYISN